MKSMTKFDAEITAALEAHKPALAASFAHIVRVQYARIVEQFGPTARGVANSTSYKVWANTVRPCCNIVKVAGDLSGLETTYVINEERLAKAAAAYANEVVLSWLGKINEKLGELDTAECPHFEGDRFLITGTRAGKTVLIEQDRIINISSKGTIFNQFPARIYVDRKFTSAVAYKRAFAA
jgi:hypothetical protein